MYAKNLLIVTKRQNFRLCGGSKLLIFLMLVRYWISFNFAQQSFLMEQQKKNTGAYWLLFFVSTAAFIWAVATHFSFLTLILPFVFTSFVKAMDIM
jgi:hypothetical protein